MILIGGDFLGEDLIFIKVDCTPNVPVELRVLIVLVATEGL